MSFSASLPSTRILPQDVQSAVAVGGVDCLLAGFLVDSPDVLNAAVLRFERRIRRVVADDLHRVVGVGDIEDQYAIGVPREVGLDATLCNTPSNLGLHDHVVHRVRTPWIALVARGRPEHSLGDP